MFTKHNWLIITLLVADAYFAQTLKEFNCEELPPPQVTQVFRENTDDAILVFYTPLSGVTFESNTGGIVKQDTKEDKVIVYIKSKERMYITIKKKEYLETKVSIMPMDPKAVRYFKLEEKVTAELSLIPVNILTNPAGALIYIDEEFKGVTTTHQISAGVHKLRVEAAGYKTHVTDIEVSASNTLFNIKLSKIDVIGVKFLSVPTEAEVFIDNKSIGYTSIGEFLFPGTYQIRLAKSGYLPVEETIEVTENGKTEYSFNLTQNIGWLKVEVEPTGATLLVNKRERNYDAAIELTPGKYKVELTKKSYYSEEETIDIQLGETINRNYKLKPRTGKLQFSVSPLEARAELTKDGIVAAEWTGMKIIDDLMVDTYQLKVNLNGYKSVVQEVTIDENTPAVVRIILEKGEDAVTTNSDCGTSTVTYSGKTYNTVKIGNQCWLKQNLDVGRKIQGNQEQTNNAVLEKYCHDNLPANCETYGGLYQWNEAMQYVTTAGTQGICPPGWHIPTYADLQTLASAVGNDGNALKALRQGTGSGAGTNTSGFSALLAGYRYTIGSFDLLSVNAYFWSSTESNSTDANYMYLGSSISNVFFYFSNKSDGFSVRCVEDN